MNAIAGAPAQPAPSVVPASVSWKVRPGDIVAHAFGEAGWQRSVCRGIRWSAAVQDPPLGARRCDDCDLLVNGAPGEITEAYGR